MSAGFEGLRRHEVGCVDPVHDVGIYDAGVGNKADRTALREPMSAMTVVVAHLRWMSAVLD